MKIDDRAIGLFEDEHFSLQMIGDFFGVTRQGVKKYLNTRGIDTGNKGKVETTCETCGKVFEKHRAYFRLRIKNYCSPQCYYDSIKNPDYIQHRQGSTNARKAILECGYRLDDNEIVHHIDGNQDNNDPNNLMVFKNNSEHMRWHRAGKEESGVIPVWPEVEVKDTNLQKGVLAKLSSAEKKIQIVVDKISDDVVKTRKGPVKANAAMAGFFNPQPKAKWKGAK